MPGNTIPRLVVVEVMPTITGNGATLALACSTPGIVVGGTELAFTSLAKPAYILLKLVSAAGLRFPPDPSAAAWFGRGPSKPAHPGNAGGKFDPMAVSDAGDLLLFRVLSQADHGQFAALLNLDQAGSTSTTQAGTTSLRAAAISGGPIIIND